LTVLKSSLNPVSQSFLTIYICVGSPALVARLGQLLKGDRYQTTYQLSANEFIQTVESQKHLIDCLILEQTPELPNILKRLHQGATLLPAIILMPMSVTQAAAESQQLSTVCSYHTAEVWLQQSQLGHISQQIERAISQFLHLTTACRLPEQVEQDMSQGEDPEWQSHLGVQQQRLSDKLQERLGYLGVYYKRNSQDFLRNLSESAKQSFLEELKSDYRDIVLEYFQKENRINQKIDAFVTKVFLADVSISQILEMHMELMDAFAKKLKLEGRSEDILLDYRLTLIDTVAHLGEMYRRSIPRDA
jgi:circadian clock protein KaiA